MKKSLFALSVIAAMSGLAHGAVPVAAPATPYSQDFDSLLNSGTANSWLQDSTILGWSLFTATNTDVATYRADTGASNTGAIYSYGSAASTDRAFGSVGSAGFPGGYIAASFTNTSGAAFDSFTLGFDGEQWRNGGNTTAQTMVLQYGFGATFSAVGTTWVTPGGAFNFVSPIATATAAAVNGNVEGKVTGLGGTITTNWAAGDTLWVRWVETNDLGNDHGLAIDNFRMSAAVSAVPEPGTWAMLLAGVAGVGFIARRRKV